MRLPEGLTRNLTRQVLQVKKQSPHIFFAAGVVGAVGSAVLACKATLKLEAVLDEVKADIEHVKSAQVEVAGEPISDTERNRVLGVKYARGSLKVARLYAPAAGLGLASIGLLTGSHIQLVRRNSALTAAFTAVAKAYDDYRQRVRNEVGPEKEQEIYHGIETQEIVTSNDGKTAIAKVINPNARSPYARVFDEDALHWKKNAELNMYFLNCQQEYANNKLRVYGVVLLNDVYDMLGFERTRQGALVGWVRNDDDDRCEGDGYIDFHIHTLDNAQFINDLEPRVLLDFNVDGIVYDKI